MYSICLIQTGIYLYYHVFCTARTLSIKVKQHICENFNSSKKRVALLILCHPLSSFLNANALNPCGNNQCTSSQSHTPALLHNITLQILQYNLISFNLYIFKGDQLYLSLNHPGDEIKTNKLVNPAFLGKPLNSETKYPKKSSEEKNCVGGDMDEWIDR